MRRAISALAVLAGLASSPTAFAFPTTVVDDDTPDCDVLAVPADVHELGIAPAFANFPTERISAASTIVTDPACASTDSALPNARVLITNTTGIIWRELWYVADPPNAAGAGGTTLSNDDGVVNGGLAFKIDAVGINTPLIFESIAADGIFVPGETWHFLIDDYANAAGLLPEALDSLGVGSASAGGPPSSGSIIAVEHPVPEPASAAFAVMAAGLVAARLGRRRRA